jgi:hypothetical protein
LQARGSNVAIEKLSYGFTVSTGGKATTEIEVDRNTVGKAEQFYWKAHADHAPAHDAMSGLQGTFQGTPTGNGGMHIYQAYEPLGVEV